MSASTPPRSLLRRLLLPAAILFVLFAVLLALLPTLAGGWVAGKVQEEVGARCAGRVEVSGLSLAWFSRQRLERTTLWSPQGERVATVAAELPSLVDLLGAAGGKIGTVRVELEADLAAADDGSTNLERALAPRSAPAPQPEQAPAGEPFDLAGFVRALDLDFELVAPRLSWSDATMRKQGAPFELRQLRLTATAKPGQPLQVQGAGVVAAQQPGGLKLAATVRGLLQAPGRPFASLDADVALTNFSSGFVDALALQQGRLQAQLGDSFDLSLQAKDATLESGSVHASLVAPRTRLELNAQLVDGVVLQSQPPFLRLETPTPRAYLVDALQPFLPAGARLSIEASERPWTVEIARARLPLSAATATGAAARRAALEQCELALDLSLPMRASWNDAALLQQGVQPVLADPVASVRLEPGAGATLHLESEVAAGASGRLTLDAACRAPGEFLAGAVPPCDASLRIAGLPLAAIDGLAGLQGRLVRFLGAGADIDVSVRQANLTGGSLSARIKAPRAQLDFAAKVEQGELLLEGADALTLRLSPGRELLQAELAPFVPQGAELAALDGELVLRAGAARLPLEALRQGESPLAAVRRAGAAELELLLPGLRWSDPALQQESLAVALTRPRVSLQVQPGGAVRARFECGLETGASGRVACDLGVADWGAVVSAALPQGLPPIDAVVRVEGVSVPLVEALAGQRGRLGPLLGPALALQVDAQQLNLSQGRLSLSLSGQTSSVAAALRLEQGKLLGAGDEALRVSLRAAEQALAPLVAPYLPEGAGLSWPAGGVELQATLAQLELPLPAFDALASTPLASLAAPLRARLQLQLAGCAIAEPHLARLGVAQAELRRLELDARLAPEEGLVADAKLALAAVEPFDLAARISVAKPLQVLDGGALPAVQAELRCGVLPGKLVDRVAGMEGLWADMLGEGASLVARARLDGLSTPAPAVDAALELRSSTTTLDASFALKDGVLSAEQALALSMKPDTSRLKARLAPLLPAGQQVELVQDSPLAVRATKVSLVLPKEGLDLWAALARSSALLEVQLPELVWSDAALRAAGRVVRLRALALESGLVPGQLAAVAFRGEVVDEPPGTLQARVQLLDELSALSAPDGWKKARIALRVELQRLPTALLDVLAAQDGLLVEALGPRVDAGAESSGLSLASGAFEAQLRSGQHSVVAHCRFEDAKLVVDRLDGVVAQVGLGPLVSQRVVGKLVPTLVQVTKAEGAAPVSLHIDTLTVPFDADLRALDAKVRLELGEVQYALLPGLDALFGSGGTPKVSSLPTIEVQIVKGVARYDRLPVKIGGKEHIFAGSYDLVDGKMSLTAGIPLAAFGKKFNKELDSVRDIVPADTVVPVELYGTWSSPKVRIGKKFLDELLERAAAKALGDLFGGDKKKP